MIFITHKHIFLSIAATLVFGSLAVLLTLGLPLGIDFTGGSLTETSYEERPAKAEREQALNDIGRTNYSLREATSEDGAPSYVLRTRDLTEDERIAVEATMTGLGVGGELERFTSVGPVIGQELRDKAVWAIGGVVLIIILYVAYAFRGISKIGTANVQSWMYGAITIAALVHDVIVPTAAFALLGYFTGAEADVLFVMALLAVLGYSVNDTIVVFDRVRENLKLRQEELEMLARGRSQAKKEAKAALEQVTFAEIVGQSVNQTLMRSINTSITTMLALSALYVFGGDVTENFALVLLAGVLAGTYSSIALANPLLVFISERLPERKLEDETKQKDANLPPGIPPGSGYPG